MLSETCCWVWDSSEDPEIGFQVLLVYFEGVPGKTVEELGNRGEKANNKQAFTVDN